jgi:hypothetical protein
MTAALRRATTQSMPKAMKRRPMETVCTCTRVRRAGTAADADRRRDL